MLQLMQKIAEILQLSTIELRWRKLAKVLAVIVVFGTTYMLILPAITLEDEIYCGITEHTHNEECFVIESRLICCLEETASEETTLEETASEETTLEETASEETTLEETALEETTLEETTLEETASEETTLEETAVEETTVEAHQHTDACYEYTEVLVCELAAHTHNEICFIKPDSNSEQENQQISAENITLSNGIQLVAQKSDEWLQEVLTYAETLDENYLLSLTELSAEDRYKVLKMNYILTTLPDYDEFTAELDRLYEEGNEAAEEEYYRTTHNQVGFAYAYYQLVEHLNDFLNPCESLFEMWDILCNSPQGLVSATTSSYQVNFVDSDWSDYVTTAYITPVVFYKYSPAEAYGISAWWRGYVVEYNSQYNYYYVSRVVYNTNSTSDIYGLKATTSKGFVIVIWSGDSDAFSGTADVVAGDIVNISFDPTSATAGYKSAGYGTISFSPASELYTGKDEKDNSSQLHIIESANTYDLIKINLYDYKSNINELYNTNSSTNGYAYPGFQQDYGTKTTLSSIGLYNFNFGNTVTTDLLAGITNVSSTAANNNRTGTLNIANSSYGSNAATENAMGYLLTEDGYPQTANGTSLKFLFDGGTYSYKQNTDNITGLFQQNAETGEYFYNSRLNHAQFDPDTDTFVLYEERITPNFMMYPFGNFMPFFDIVHDSKKSSEIDGDYLLEIAKSARYKYQNGEGTNAANSGTDEYLGLYNGLSSFVSLMNGIYSTGWDACDAANYYFKLNSIKDASGNYISFTNDDIDDLYTLDYDEPSNFYFGMDIEMNFLQPKDGLTGISGTEELVFFFTGDDDVWVYIDNVLFLDLSGIHRHVGGKIDFVRGEVSYYRLLPETGDVSETPYLTETFETILTRAGQSTETLNENGTFKNYTLHNFKFYYMERGSGSGICRMNFNLPLVEDNTIAITKEISTEDGDLLKILGDPDYKFMIKKAVSDTEKTDELFIAANTVYDLVDSAGNFIRKGITDENGIITLKAGETAIFPVTQEMLESELRYYVCELIDSDISGQYGDIYVDNEVVKKEVNGIVVDGETFDHFHSNIKNIFDGDTSFYYDNLATFSELGALQITKQIVGEETDEAFDFELAFDGIPISEGTEYTLISADGTESVKTVENEGIISLMAGESAFIQGLLAGSIFTVSETDESRGIYTLYFAESEYYTSNSNTATGTVLPASTVKPITVTATNTERGASVEFNGTKTLTHSDGISHDYTFVLAQVTDLSGETLVENSSVLEKKISISGNAGETTSTDYSIILNYYDSVVNEGTQKYYYKLYEKPTDGFVESTIFDTDIYIIEVTVTKSEQSIEAQLTAAYKNGELLGDSPSFDFENTLLGQLTVSKQVVDALEFKLEQTPFSFDVFIEYENQPLEGTYTLIISDSSGNEREETLTLSQGKATLSICHGESFTIKGLPITCVVTVSETAQGFYIYYTVNGEEKINVSDVAQLTINSGNNLVAFTNQTQYVLPETGGSGNEKLYIIGGMFSLSGFAFFLRYINKRKRRRENSS